MWDLVSLGELLIDFTPSGTSANGNPLFERNPGGGPGNMACAAAKLGARTAFIGQVGDDAFGRTLRDVVQKNGVDVSRLRLSPDYQTSLAFVHLDEHGDRSFSFYRRHGADTMLEAAPEDYALIDDCRAFFYSSVLMTAEPARTASFRLAEYAHRRGVTTVFDPNLRLNLWDSAAHARDCILRAMPYADIVKVSEEELVFLTGENDLEKAAAALRNRFAMKALLVTLGPAGCIAYVGKDRYTQPAADVETIDTTGAGDSFTGGFLYCLLQGKADVTERTAAEMQDMLAFANAVGGLTTTQKGGIPALPSYNDVLNLLHRI
ncbi:MAG: carbohydrate kinase family protein [Acutalibacteraceae bacterium]